MPITKLGKNTIEQEEPENNEKGYLQRAFLTGTGLSLGSSYSGLASPLLTGRKTGYHATALNPENTKSNDDIIRSINDSGIKTEYAGRARRLNSVMARNTLHNLVIDSIKDPEAKQEAINKLKRNFDAVDDYYKKADFTKSPPRSTMQGKGYIDDLANETKSVLKNYGVSVDDNKINNYLSKRGRRIYLGNSPKNVLQWGGQENELTQLYNNFRKTTPSTKGKQIAKVVGRVADVGTGGGMSALTKETIPKIKYRLTETPKAKKENVPFSTVKDIDSLGVDKSNVGSVVYKTRLGDKNLKSFGAMKDFPGVGPAMSSNASLRRTMGDYMPHLYSMGRDLSTSADIDPSQIEEMHVFDKDNKLNKILKNKEFKAPQKASILKRLKTSGPATAATLAAGDLISRGVTNDGLYTHGKNIHDKLINKEAALANSTKDALKWGGGIGGVLGAGSALAASPVFYHNKKLKDSEKQNLELNKKIQKIKSPDSKLDKLVNKEHFKDLSTSEAFPTMISKAIPEVALPASAGGIVSESEILQPLGIGNYSGMMGSSSTLPLGGVGEGGKDTIDNIVDKQRKYDSYKDYLKKQTLPASVLGAGVLGSVGYNLKKNYGHDLKSQKDRLSALVKSRTKQLNDEGLLNTAKRYVKNNPKKSGILGAGALTGAGLFGLSTAYADKYKRDSLDEVNKTRERELAELLNKQNS